MSDGPALKALNSMFERASELAVTQVLTQETEGRLTEIAVGETAASALTVASRLDAAAGRALSAL